MKKYILFLFAFISLIVFFEGCTPSAPSEEVEILPADRLVNRLEANRRKIRSFEGKGVIDIKTSEFDNSASFKVTLNKPDSVYMVVLGPFGIELAQILVTKNNFNFYDALNNTLYKGAVDNEVLKNIFRINLPLTDIVDAFVGSVNLTDKLYITPDYYEVEKSTYRLTYVDSVKNVSTEFRVDIRDLGITEYWIKDFRKLTLLEGKYSNFTIAENVAIPSDIVVRNPVLNQQIKISYKDIKVNQRGSSIKFIIPPDATVIEW